MKNRYHVIKIVVTICFLVSANYLRAQDWALMYGDCTFSLLATHGTIGIGSGTTQPGGRYGSSTFKDVSGNLWLFGGAGPIASNGKYNDLWRYNIASSQWTWMKGGNLTNKLSDYGSMGVPSSTNTPGSRYGSYSWTDLSGNFWIFGGYGYPSSAATNTANNGALNDLWRYNVSTNEWTWMNGTAVLDDPGAYGTLGVPSATNIPKSRWQGVTWVDANGMLWLFGGLSPAGRLNDLWKYNPSNNQWTWVSGSSSANQAGVYGTMTVPSLSTIPGARWKSSSWTDNAGDLWLFGGEGYTSTFGDLNDLWKYNISTNQWTWMNGYTSPLTSPSPRSGSTSSKDNNGNFWLHGGGLSAQLWKYNISNNQWTNTRAGVNPSCYAFGFASPLNELYPCMLAQSWADNCGNMWVQGGLGVSPSLTFNYLWKLNLNGPQNINTWQNLNVCNGASTTLSVTGGPTINWYASLNSSTSIGTGSIFPTGTLSTGSYSYYAESSSCSINNTRAEIILNVGDPTISFSGPNSSCAGETIGIIAMGANTYTWVSPTTTTVSAMIYMTPTVSTQFTVTGKNAYGCSGSATLSVPVYSVPVLSVTGNSVACNGTPIIKTAAGAASYTWTGVAISNTVSLTPPTSRTYTVRGTSVNSCTSSLVFSVNILPLPAISINSGSVCANAIFTLSPVGATNYTLSSGANTVSPSSNTVYLVSTTGTNGCIGTAASTVVVNPLPLVSVANGTLCSGKYYTIVPTGASTYTFSGGSSYVSPPVSTIFSVTGTSTAGCRSAVAATMQILVFTTPSITVSNTVVCAGKSFSVEATGAASYLLNGGSPVRVPTANTTYTVVGISAQGCVSDIDFCSVIVYPLPDILIVASKSISCAGEPITFYASGATTYTWNDGSTADTLTASPLVNTNFFATGVNSYGCINGYVFSQVVNACTSIAINTHSTTFTLYPNPVKDLFIIESASLLPDAEVKIYNEIGQVVAREWLVQEKTTILLKNFCGGIYNVVILKDGLVIRNEKLVVE